MTDDGRYLAIDPSWSTAKADDVVTACLQRAVEACIAHQATEPLNPGSAKHQAWGFRFDKLLDDYWHWRDVAGRRCMFDVVEAASEQVYDAGEAHRARIGSRRAASARRTPRPVTEP